MIILPGLAEAGGASGSLKVIHGECPVRGSGETPVSLVRISLPPPLCPVAAGILPAVEPGILPGGMAVLRHTSAGPGGRMPPSTAGRMPAATGRSEEHTSE